jgi:hypothetical protein
MAQLTGPIIQTQTDPVLAYRQRLVQLSKTRRVFVQPASPSDIRNLHAMLTDHIEQPVATVESACAIQDASPESIWSIHSATELLGGIAFLPLNALGLYQLVYGKLDLLNPAVNAVAGRIDRPAILYLWAIVSRGRGIIGLADIMDHLDRRRFRHVDIWTSPVTPRGERLAEQLGFTRFSHANRVFYRLKRTGP